MAQNRAADTGVSAAKNRTTRQASANSLRKEIIEFSYATSNKPNTGATAKYAIP